ncbi:MAG: helix-turn-helix transcriptional regulator [Bacteroidota bacterium]
MEIIKQLRRKNKINQSDLASAIGVSLRTVQLYEKKDANIPIKNLNKIADFFEMSIGELYLYEVNEGDGYYSKGQPFVKGRSFGYRLDNGKVLLKVPLLPTELQNDFLKEGDKDDFVKKLIRMDFLLQSPEDTFYMAFEITGEAMDDRTSHSIPNGALVLGKKVDKLKLHSNKGWVNKAFVFICTNRIICKSITDISMDTATIICHNLNPSPEFKDFEIQLNEVSDVYEVIKKQV